MIKDWKPPLRVLLSRLQTEPRPPKPLPTPGKRLPLHQHHPPDALALHLPILPQTQPLVLHRRRLYLRPTPIHAKEAQTGRLLQVPVPQILQVARLAPPKARKKDQKNHRRRPDA